MFTRFELLALVLALVAAPAAAQRTWIVDLDNGPGTDFLDIPPAVAAAGAGDTILVRESPRPLAYYNSPSISRALRLIGLGSPLVLGAIDVSNVPAGHNVVMRSFVCADYQPRRIDCLDNQGSVHFEDITFGVPGSARSTSDGIVILRCALVTFRGCTIWAMGPSIFLSESTVFAVDSVFQQNSVWLVPPVHEALRCDRGAVVTLVDCRVIGANGWVPAHQCTALFYPLPAVMMHSGILRATGNTEILGGTTSGSHQAYCNWHAEAIVGYGTVELDPRVRVRGSTGRFTNPGQHPLTGLATGAAERGNCMLLTAYAEPNANVWLFVGSPVPQPIRLPWGDVWLDMRPHALVLLLGGGVADSQGIWRASLPVFHGLPVGMPFLFQAVTLRWGSTFKISTPSVSVVR